MSVSEHTSRAAEIAKLSIAIITVSDTRTAATDRSGDAIETHALAHAITVGYRTLVPDEPPEILTAINTAVSAEVDAIVLTGGTGVARRDTTVDTIRSLPGETLEGFGELFRVESYSSIGAVAMLSRACAVIYEPIDGTRIPVFALPGSTNAVETAMRSLIVPTLRHLVWQCRS